MNDMDILQEGGSEKDGIRNVNFSGFLNSIN